MLRLNLRHALGLLNWLFGCYALSFMQFRREKLILMILPNRLQNSFDFDREGYLKDSAHWCCALAEDLAAQEGLCLTSDHWEVIFFFRDFYSRFNCSPPLRLLIKGLQKVEGGGKWGSSYLQSLFPGGVAKQASKIAGLPKPVKCL